MAFGPSRIGVGVDIGDSFVAVMRAVSRGRRAPTASAAFPGGGVVRPADLASALRRADPSGRAVLAAALPAHDALIRRLSAPIPSISRARRIMPSLLDVQLPFPLEQCAAVFIGFERGPGENVTALAAAAREEQVGARLAALSAASLNPHVLDHEALAIWEQSLREDPPASPSAPRAVAYAGMDRMTVAVGRGRQLLAVFGSRWGGRDFMNAGDSGAAAAACAAWVERLRRSLSIPPGGGDDEPRTWFWCGPAAAQPDFTAALESLLKTDLSTSFRAHDDPATFLARALAVRAATNPVPCNLRQGARTHPSLAAAANRAERRQAIRAAAAGVLLLALGFGWSAWLDARSRAAQDDLTLRTLALTGLPRVDRGMEVRLAADAARRQAIEWAPVERAFAPGLLSAVRGTLAAAAASKLCVGAIEWNATGAVVRGTSPDWDACAKMEGFLQAGGFRTKLNREDAGADERVGFEIRGGRP